MVMSDAESSGSAPFYMISWFRNAFINKTKPRDVAA